MPIIKIKPIEERFWNQVKKTATCWLWLGYTNERGYGYFRKNRDKRVRVHRFAYELIKGKIPKGLTIDHLCRVRHCVNPNHLEAVTFLENIGRGKEATKTHCHRGHKFTKENTRMSHGSRVCKMCHRLRTRERRLKLKKYAIN